MVVTATAATAATTGAKFGEEEAQSGAGVATGWMVSTEVSTMVVAAALIAALATTIKAIVWRRKQIVYPAAVGEDCLLPPLMRSCAASAAAAPAPGTRHYTRGNEQVCNDRRFHRNSIVRHVGDHHQTTFVPPPRRKFVVSRTAGQTLRSAASARTLPQKSRRSPPMTGLPTRVRQRYTTIHYASSDGVSDLYGPPPSAPPSGGGGEGDDEERQQQAGAAEEEVGHGDTIDQDSSMITGRSVVQAADEGQGLMKEGRGDDTAERIRRLEAKLEAVKAEADAMASILNRQQQQQQQQNTSMSPTGEDNGWQEGVVADARDGGCEDQALPASLREDGLESAFAGNTAEPPRAPPPPPPPPTLDAETRAKALREVVESLDGLAPEQAAQNLAEDATRKGVLLGFGAAPLLPKRNYSDDELRRFDLDPDGLEVKEGGTRRNVVTVLDSALLLGILQIPELQTLDFGQTMGALLGIEAVKAVLRGIDRATNNGGLKELIVDGVACAFDASYRERVAIHEAGKFLAAYLVGVMPGSYTLFAADALKEESSLRFTRGVRLADKNLERALRESLGGFLGGLGGGPLVVINNVEGGDRGEGQGGDIDDGLATFLPPLMSMPSPDAREGMTDDAVDKLAVLAMAGTAAEILVLDSAQEDLSEAEQLGLLFMMQNFGNSGGSGGSSSNDGMMMNDPLMMMANADATDFIKWANLQCAVLLRDRIDVIKSLAEAMRANKSIGELVTIIEQAEEEEASRDNPATDIAAMLQLNMDSTRGNVVGEDAASQGSNAIGGGIRGVNGAERRGTRGILPPELSGESWVSAEYLDQEGDGKGGGGLPASSSSSPSSVFATNPSQVSFVRRQYFYGRVAVELGPGFKTTDVTFNETWKDATSALCVVELATPLGVSLGIDSDSTELKNRVQVLEVSPGSSADRAGIQVGDLVRAVSARGSSAGGSSTRDAKKADKGSGGDGAGGFAGGLARLSDSLLPEALRGGGESSDSRRGKSKSKTAKKGSSALFKTDNQPLASVLEALRSNPNGRAILVVERKLDD